MIILTPEKIDFKISCVDLELIYTEQQTTLKVEGYTLDEYLIGDIFSELNLIFKIVAEVKCTTMNFFETHYKDISLIDPTGNQDKITFWKEKGYHPNSGFYQVSNSEYLETKRNLYDPNNKLDLKHFLIVGYDSYVEIIASQFKISGNILDLVMK